MKKSFRSLTLITAVILMFSLFSCGKSRQFDIAAYKDRAPKTLLVGTEDNCYRLNLDPEYGYYEEFNFPSTIISDGAFVVMIENVRAGSTYKDTCISELWFW